jgi:hypothetical protein
MQIKIIRSLKFDFGDYDIILDKNKIGIWKSTEKEIELKLDNSVSSKLYLKLLGLKVTNSILVNPQDDLNIEFKRNYLANFFGFFLFIIVVLSPFESVWVSITILNFENSFISYAICLVLGLYLMSLKKLKVVKK